MKKILEACIEQKIRFNSETEWLVFHRELKAGKKAYEILNEKKSSDGSVVVHLRKQYNNNKFPKAGEQK